MKVYWTDEAMRDLDTVFAHISRDSPVNALRVIDRLTDRSKQIRQFPYSGRKAVGVAGKDIREVFEGRYRILYSVGDDIIEILGVTHTARIH